MHTNDSHPTNDQPGDSPAVTIAGIEYRLCISLAPMRGADGTRYDCRVDHCRRVLLFDPDLSPSRALRIGAQAVALAWRELRDIRRARRGVPPAASAAEGDGESAVGVRGDPPAAGAARDGAHEALPAGELDALADDLRAAQWKLNAPPGWPMPPGLPTDVVIPEPPAGYPPIPLGTRRRYCPHCGASYRQMSWLKKHLRAAHGWRARPDGELLPPASHDQGQQRRAA